ncbi:uncharacterized protein LY89DRAFT_734141 [Mollisia scopiformis]|uniref:Uncharacterized protein n=1 Tax=Mollisia scopiformis TaxID=149040 RepID=A0A194XAF9_MOLSC|nr:uncharacterized protein LY89DRAFT_734141 [Mollisia scopiformis]KUJ17155.1 hypothetical protein LY89DRAFT_734141 [Mollisia scopiformis]
MPLNITIPFDLLPSPEKTYSVYQEVLQGMGLPEYLLGVHIDFLIYIVCLLVMVRFTQTILHYEGRSWIWSISCYFLIQRVVSRFEYRPFDPELARIQPLLAAVPAAANLMLWSMAGLKAERNRLRFTEGERNNLLILGAFELGMGLAQFRDVYVEWARVHSATKMAGDVAGF